MARLISRVELARIARVSGAAITKACRGPLAPAVVGNRIDLDHPTVAAYLERRGISEPEQLSAAAAEARRPPPKRDPVPPPAPPAPSPDQAPASERRPTVPPAPSPEPKERGPVRLVAREVTDISQVADMTIRQIVAKFGTITQFKDWLQALRQIEEVHEKRLRNAETDGNLISIRLVQTHVMGAIERAFRRLLTDSPKSIARTLYAAAKSGVPIEDAERLVRESISAQLKPLKDGAARVLRNAQPDLEKTA